MFCRVSCGCRGAARRADRPGDRSGIGRRRLRCPGDDDPAGDFLPDVQRVLDGIDVQARRSRGND
jgi:hypothetical protein